METKLESKSVEIEEEIKLLSPEQILELIFPGNEIPNSSTTDQIPDLSFLGHSPFAENVKSFVRSLNLMRNLLQEAKEKDKPVVIYFSFDPQKIKCCAGEGHSYVCKVIHVGKSFMKIKKLAICGSIIDEDFIKKEIPPEIFLYVDADKFLSKVSFK